MQSLNREHVIYRIKLLNALTLLGLTLILVLAFLMQFTLAELPCPLCLLQRAGLIGIGFGFLLNVRYEIRASHYALSLLAAVFSAWVSMRQILLHIVPGTGSYGNAIFGLHMYTWVFILSFATIIYIALIMSWQSQYTFQAQSSEEHAELKSPWAKRFCHLAFAAFFLATIGNVVSIISECGFHECSDNPVAYVL